MHDRRDARGTRVAAIGGNCVHAEKSKRSRAEAANRGAEAEAEAQAACAHVHMWEGEGEVEWSIRSMDAEQRLEKSELDAAGGELVEEIVEYMGR